jgi:hypothetical protein
MSDAAAPVKKVSKSKISPFSQAIINAIKGLKERSGSSREAIKKVLSADASVNQTNLAANVRTALKRGVASGLFVQVKQSFKLSDAAKKPAAAKKPKAKKAVAAKKPKAKKAAATKKPASKKPKAATKKAAKPAKKATKKAASKKPKAAKKAATASA